MGHRWNGTDRREWGIGGTVLTGRVEHWWNGTDRGEWSVCVGVYSYGVVWCGVLYMYRCEEYSG